MTEYIEDLEFFESIINGICPYCESSLFSPHPNSDLKQCRCGFELYGDPMAVAYDTKETDSNTTIHNRQCPECGSKDLFYERKERELVCHGGRCGLVLTGQHPYVAGHIKIDYPFGLHMDRRHNPNKPLEEADYLRY